MSTRFCDLVMKGGITSGVVYPSLVLKLKEGGYRFANIGGTSAGAIAAAATAAAEYGERLGTLAGDNPVETGKRGFEGLEDLQDQFSKGTFVRDLFQPTRQTRPLLEVLLQFTEKAKKAEGLLGWLKTLVGMTATFLRYTLWSALLGLVVGIGIALVLAWLFAGSLESLTGRGLLPTIVLAWLGLVLAAIGHLLYVLLKKVPENGYGICTGSGNVNRTKPVLTDWLSQQFEQMAGKKDQDTPLTFGDLEKRSNANQKWEPIILRMMTSNVSQNQPYVLPFREDELFLFKKSDFENLFPENIVAYLTKDEFIANKKDHYPVIAQKYAPPEGFYFLPKADFLPIIVATRMSLSFPVLLSAVPLYTIKAETVSEEETCSDNKITRKSADEVALKESDLLLNWFSDGGICSNFPIHFFDKWLPNRPTFGVNLTSLPAEAMEQREQDKHKVKSHVMTCKFYGGEQKPSAHRLDDIYLPKADDLQEVEVKPLVNESGQRSLPKFLWAIFSTAQNYRDNAQSVLPGYRERVVQIRLSDNEGGLNLFMPTSTIEKIIGKGRRAGELLDTFELRHHQWVRFRVLISQLEKTLAQMKTTLGPDDSVYWHFLQTDLKQKKYPYPCVNGSLQEAGRRLKRLAEAIQDWKPMESLTDEPKPLPASMLRTVPDQLQDLGQKE